MRVARNSVSKRSSLFFTPFSKFRMTSSDSLAGLSGKTAGVAARYVPFDV